LAQQDDYYYEIQLSNKQLVFYFLAGATGLILSFLAGVMVGRGVDNSANAADVQVTKPVHEERVVPEESPKPSAKPAEELTYAARLESEKADDSLQKGARADASPAAAKASPPSRPSPAPSAKASAAPKPSPKPTAAAVTAKPPATGTFTIQVGAFKDRETADGVVARLKKKGFAAFVVAPDGSDNLFNVRVGSYTARADAERVQTKLRDEEKFKPFIVKN
jgi:cell division septation protein DedD